MATASSKLLFAMENVIARFGNVGNFSIILSTCTDGSVARAGDSSLRSNCPRNPGATGVLAVSRIRPHYDRQRMGFEAKITGRYPLSSVFVKKPFGPFKIQSRRSLNALEVETVICFLGSDVKRQYNIHTAFDCQLSFVYIRFRQLPIPFKYKIIKRRRFNDRVRDYDESFEKLPPLKLVVESL